MNVHVLIHEYRCAIFLLFYTLIIFIYHGPFITMESQLGRSMEGHKDQNSTTDNPDFSAAIDIACCAREAARQSIFASEKASHISDLAYEADREAKKLHALAENLIDTAAQVASIKMSNLNFRDLREAYDSDKNFQSKINYDSFHEIVSGRRAMGGGSIDSYHAGMECYNPMGHNRDPRIHPLTQRTNYDYYGNYPVVQHPGYNNVVPSYAYDQYPRHIQEHLPASYEKTSFSAYHGRRPPTPRYMPELPHHAETETSPHNISDESNTRDVRNLGTPNTEELVKFAPTDPRLSRREATTPNKPKSLSPFPDKEKRKSEGENTIEKYKTEKFPLPRLPDEYREELACSFDNTSCTTPLWEDRYVHDVCGSDRRRSSVPFPGAPENWKEKKAFKQFQIKMQQIVPDPEAGSQDNNASTMPAQVPTPFRSTGPVDQAEQQVQQECADQSHFQQSSAQTEQELSTLTKMPHIHVLPQRSDDTTIRSTMLPEQDTSSDSEVEGIFQEGKPLRKLKEEARLSNESSEYAATVQLTLPDISKKRSASPLLSDEEKSNYQIQAEENPKINHGNRQKYVYHPRSRSPSPSPGYKNRTP